MEVCAESSHCNGKQTLKHSKSADEVKRSSEKTYRGSHSNGKQNLKQTSTFVNHAAIAWHEDRRKWVGDKSRHPPRTPKDPIISKKWLNHGVLLVGYGAKGFSILRLRNKPYWIIKNSWGERWGENGYYRLCRGHGMCGMNTMVSAAMVAQTQPATHKLYASS